MEALLIIDMQRGMLDCDPQPQNVEAIVQTINRLSAHFRQTGRPVIFVQHSGAVEDSFAEGKDGWHFLSTIERAESDLIVSKTTCDAFYKSKLKEVLVQREVSELVICGWATDFCVDTTIRAAASREYSITVVADGHTAADRPHLDAASIINHHHHVWSDLIVPTRSIRIQSSAAIIGAT